MAIKCCKDCVPPTRHPGCHGTCEQYKAEKAKWEEEKPKPDKIRFTQSIQTILRC